MGDKYKKSGWGFLIYGFTLSIIMLVYFQYIKNFNDLSLMYYLLSIAVFILTLATSICGYYLINYNSKIHKFSVPIAWVLMINVPVGTFIGGAYLWIHLKNKDDI
jgi:hypothetical protein